MYSILIVEDENLELEFCEAVIRGELAPDDAFHTASTGVQAVRIARKVRPDIIFMDIALPEMGGLDAAEKIRKFAPDACISILTAYNDFHFAQRAVGLGIFSYLLKPIRPEAIKDVLKRMMERVDKQREYAHIRTFDMIQPISEEDGQSGKKNDFVDESIRYITQHYKERLTLQMVASRVYVNPQYFSRVFRCETGVAFTEYINSLKIQYACKLLETTNYPVYRISSECGFTDPSYFNRVFSARMNITPKQYRKLSRKLQEKPGPEE